MSSYLVLFPQKISGMPSVGMFPVKKEVKLVVLEAGLFKLNLLY